MSRALVIGAGPAGLMAAETLSAAGVTVTLCEAKPSVGRKFLMAGKSGLNLTKDEPVAALLSQYETVPPALDAALRAFDSPAVQKWTQGLGQEIFTGSTGRVFPSAMKASPLLRAWLARLNGQGVTVRTRLRWRGWDAGDAVFDGPQGRETIAAEVTVIATGGASWARLGSDGTWSDVLEAEGVALAAFAPSNAGLVVPWSTHMAPFFGQAIKSVRWKAGDITSRGEAILSARGLEGGGIYSLSPAFRAGASLAVDLVPDLSHAALTDRLPARNARLGPWLKSTLRLPPVKTALVFEVGRALATLPARWPGLLKALRLPVAGFLPMDEAISTAGGVQFDALTPELMLKAMPGVFCAGEMLDWDAPTGGYLITACLATGQHAARGALAYLEAAA
ncbi:TIGR03862 family flavoprotein [Roseobacter sp.]|uniref:TIGR03862 family flavoprotein n=1 Tax=Roseobacter sp. TaxID=1907202 RepID=UPI0025EA6D8F|nr:TIGR03862 family flavoprotein [Roseobacter sp.]